HWKGINEIGACRVCVVEVEGCSNLPAACVTNVADGMVIHTSSPRVVSARRVNAQLILSRHNCHCPSCVRNGNCALQTLSASLNITANPFPEKQIK
ncbi:MAG TPA: hydrogenase, partial [Clostridiales bacterium]|nr:hydrogenase [Clostridiales bacterium]